jgi:hypothetical protein
MGVQHLFRRWVAFNAVGAAGIGLQLGALALLLHVAHLHYLAATALAVEAAVLHNFYCISAGPGVTGRPRHGGSRRNASDGSTC